MYLSSLMINTGDNPDRPRPGRTWLRDIYRVHQRLSMAFAPKPEGSPSIFLYRIDQRIEDNSSRAVILVQSKVEPDWQRAFENVRTIFFFLAVPPQVRVYEPSFAPGERLRFRIRINLSKKIRKARDGTDLRVDRNGAPRDQSKRAAVTWNGDEGETPDAAIRQWFAKKADKRGFEPVDKAYDILHLGWVVGHKPGRPENERIRFRSALLEGTLRVTDGAVLLQTVETGLGSGKAFGFGLLSVTHRGEPDADA